MTKVKRFRTKKDGDNIAPLVGAAVTTVGSLLKNVNLKTLGKPNPGQQHRKLAAAIMYLRSLGYSNAQMQAEPLRTYIVEIGKWPEPIADVVKLGFFERGAGAFTKLIPSAPAPFGNKGTYSAPADGSGTNAIIQSVFGPVPPFGETIEDAHLYVHNLQPAGIVKTGTDLTKAIDQTNPLLNAIPVSDPLKKSDTSILKPFQPVMTDTLRERGYVPPSDLDGTAMLFYEKIVQPAQGNQYESNNIDDAIVTSILTFVMALVAKKKAGESLPPVYDKIANTGIKIEGALEQKAVESAEQKTGNWLFNNLPLVIGGAVALIILTIIIAKRK